jgi:hypothetical protein
MPIQETGWHWTWDARAFLGWNYQYRRFTDFHPLESQNWFMGGAEHRTGRGQLHVGAMLSLEPFTMQELGSPQVFQSGEMYRGAPLIHYQHPHDLVMQLGAAYSRLVGAYRVVLEADLVGNPSLGPEPFMHRASAADNPQAPLSHHQMDATHSTPGVLRIEVGRGPWAADGSWFRGEEPDDNRTDLDLGTLDSWALRGRWTHGPWSTQVSGAHLNKPEWVEPFYDVTRLTGSVAYTRRDGSLAALASWGQNRTIHGKEDGYLLEATWRPRTRLSFYARAENSTRDLLGGGRHPPGFLHAHPLAKVGALTLGVVRDVSVGRFGRLGLGGDVTGYRVPPLFEAGVGQPWSFHVFARYSGGAKGLNGHHH